MALSKEIIKKTLQGTLPGVSSHKKFLPPGRILKMAPEENSKAKHSSVLLLLFEEDHVLKVLLIKRPAHMKHHAGQIALPGGRIEANETVVDTALRETWEEIGVSSSDIEILGELSDFYVEVSRFQIHPIVGWLTCLSDLNLCHGEVEKTIHFPIAGLKPPYSSLELDTVTGKLEVPCILYEGEIIWGATAMILSEFYDLLQGIHYFPEN